VKYRMAWAFVCMGWIQPPAGCLGASAPTNFPCAESAFEKALAPSTPHQETTQEPPAKPAQVTSKLWTQFQEARAAGEATTLADFSYAGYHCGEKTIPTAAWKTFDVTRFGAVADDGKSDKDAIQIAIQAAEKNGSGVVFFPKGRFRINEAQDAFNEPIAIRSSQIVLRGSGCTSGGTELFMDRHMDARDPSKLWTAPYLIQFIGPGASKTRTTVTADAARESHTVQVADATGFQPGQWIRLSLKNNAPELVSLAVAPHKPKPAWTSLIEKGVMIDEYHRIESVDGARLTFREPIHAAIKASSGWKVLLCRPLEEIGVEDIAFRGNWLEKFVHHKNAIHDGGWSMLSLGRCANSWVRNCRFTDVNRSITVANSTAVSVENVRIDGNKGHSAINFSNTSHSIMRYVSDLAGTWHACGVSGRSSGNVVLRCEYRADTCYEAHASQPRWTLFDNISGGWKYGRWGGAQHNQPNHMRGLVFWNYRNTGKGVPGEFHFMRHDRKYGFIIMPYVIGFHGNAQAWAKAAIEVLESNGAPVLPESLYEAQLALRTGTFSK
jgi:hypothetical protein